LIPLPSFSFLRSFSLPYSFLLPPLHSSFNRLLLLNHSSSFFLIPPLTSFNIYPFLLVPTQTSLINLPSIFIPSCSYSFHLCSLLLPPSHASLRPTSFIINNSVHLLIPPLSVFHPY
jgi:hypothetical protein